MRIFLDANILFSAAKSDGAVRALLMALTKARHELVADQYVVIEARRNLAAKADSNAIPDFERLLAGIEVAGARASADPPADVQWLPDKDRPVLDAAIRLKCDVLVTGDAAHFGKGYGKRFAGVLVVSPRGLFDRVLARE